MSDNLHTDIRCFVMICWVSFRLNALFFIIIVVMLNVIMLSVIMMIGIMLSVAGVIGMVLGLYSKHFFSL